MAEMPMHDMSEKQKLAIMVGTRAGIGPGAGNNVRKYLVVVEEWPLV